MSFIILQSKIPLMAAQQNTEITNQSLVDVDFDNDKNKYSLTFVWPKVFESVFYSNLIVHRSFATDAGGVSREILSASGKSIYFGIRYFKNSGVDAVIVDYVYHGATKGKIKQGSLNIVLDGGNSIVLKPHETEFDGNWGAYNGVQEVGYYSITRDELKRICQAQTISVKIEAGEFTLDFEGKIHEMSGLSFSEKFLLMCRGFYAGLYKDDTYLIDIKRLIGAANIFNQKLKKSKIKVQIFLLFLFALVMFLFFLFISPELREFLSGLVGIKL